MLAGFAQQKSKRMHSQSLTQVQVTSLLNFYNIITTTAKEKRQCE